MARIWTKEISIELVEARGRGTMMDHVGMRISEIGDDYIKGTMPVDARTKQPLGILHGGASCVLAEGLSSAAGNYCTRGDDYCVGLEINANHIRSVTGGLVEATARPFHIGGKTQVWDVQLRQDGELTCVVRMTLMVLQPKK